MARTTANSRAAIIPNSAPKKKVFDSDDEGEGDLNATQETIGSEDENDLPANEADEEDDDDSDAAPEEEGFEDSKKSVVQQQRQQKALIEQQRADERKDRRDRDEQLKKQKSEAVKRQEEERKLQKRQSPESAKDESIKPASQLLDTSLLEEMETSDLVLPNQKNKKIRFDSDGKPLEAESIKKGSNSTKGVKKETLKEARQRLELKSRAHTGKVVKKGPVTVSVLKKNSKSMMPPKSQVIDQLRDKWYQESQKVVERRARR